MDRVYSIKTEGGKYFFRSKEKFDAAVNHTCGVGEEIRFFDDAPLMWQCEYSVARSRCSKQQLRLFDMEIVKYYPVLCTDEFYDEDGNLSAWRNGTGASACATTKEEAYELAKTMYSEEIDSTLGL